MKPIYQTYSLCPICSFIDPPSNALSKWNGKTLVKAQVIQLNNQIHFETQCPKHGKKSFLYCSHANFFHNILSFTPGLLDIPRQKKKVATLDMEDLYERIKEVGQHIENKPLIVEMDLFSQQGEQVQWFSRQFIAKQLSRIQSIMQDCNFILKINGKTVDQLEKFNDNVWNVLTLLQGSKNLVLLELTFDRIQLLSRLSNSCLENSQVYPSIHLYIQKDDEETNLQELSVSLQVLNQQFTNLQIVVRIVVARHALPDLRAFLLLLRGMKGFIKFIILDLERDTTLILQQLQNSSSDTVYQLDCVVLLQKIEQETSGEIAVSDFYPLSVAMVLEPLFQLLKYGSFNIRPSPFCAFATMLINTPVAFQSVPLSRLFNIPKLFKEMLPLLPKLKTWQQSENISGWLSDVQLMMQLKKLLSSCQLRQDLPDLFSYLLSSNETMQKQVEQVVHDAQFLIVHNLMDVGVLDMARRSRCSCLSLQNSEDQSVFLTASCQSNCL